MKDKGIIRMQQTNLNQNNCFVNPQQLPVLCEISVVIHLVQPGLMAGWQADKIQVNFEIFKINYRIRYSTFCWV